MAAAAQIIEMAKAPQRRNNSEKKPRMAASYDNINGVMAAKNNQKRAARHLAHQAMHGKRGKHGNSETCSAWRVAKTRNVTNHNESINKTAWRKQYAARV